MKSFLTNAALILTTLMLLVVAASIVATAQTYTDLYNFDGTHGTGPGQGQSCIVAQGRDGNLYGTAPGGGTNALGVVFSITPGGILKVLYNFAGDDGANPTGGLTLGTDGNFYGTTSSGGTNGWGTIFKITKSGSLTTLYSFTGGADGYGPSAPPIQGIDGNFYGTAGGAWYPTVYKITSSGTFTVLATLFGVISAPLVQGTDGDFYGTNWGYANTYGSVFKMTPKGATTVTYGFDGTHGDTPIGPLIQGSDGNFYGTTQAGGGGRYWHNGVAFRLAPKGTLKVLHKFGQKNYPDDGYILWAGLVQATDGNFYGATAFGGTEVCSWAEFGGCGVIFQITPSGAYSVLYNLDGTDGATPASTPMQHTNGKIYGLTGAGGTSGDGVVYSLDMGLGPFVSLVSTSGKVGKIVEVLGQGFTGTTGVSFNGTAASFTIKSDTYLTVTVPSGATTGPVTVTTPGASLNSSTQFRVTPKILSFSPTSGPAGTPVTITGNSLTQTTEVAFDWLKAASFTVNSDTQVTAVVPTGATTGHIQITTKGGLAVSVGVFTVTQ